MEPENRLVARELERQWETSLRTEKELEQQYARFRYDHPVNLSDDQRALIRTLATNLPRVWKAPTTTNRDRQRIVRLLIERVEITVQGETEQVAATLHWAGGFVSQHDLIRPVRCYEQTADYKRLRLRIEQLHQEGKSYAEIAEHLNAEGFHPTKQASRFQKSIVGRLLNRIRRQQSIARVSANPIQLAANEWFVVELGSKLGLPRTTLQSWITRGWVHVARKLPGYHGRFILWADAGEIHRLQRLHQTRHRFGDPPLPKELITPNVALS